MIDSEVAAAHHDLLKSVIKLLERRYPKIWRVINQEELEARRQRPRKDAFALYEAHSSSLAILRIASPTVRLAKELYAEESDKDPEFALRDGEIWRRDAARAMASWRKTKILYHIPQIMVEALAKTSLDQVLPGSVLEQIPAWSFYVPLLANKGDPSQIRGLVFHTAIDEDTATSIDEDDYDDEWPDPQFFRTNFVFVTLIERTGKRVSVSDVVRLPVWCTDLRDALERHAIVGADEKLVVLALQLLLYLCANNRELRAVSERTEPIVKCDPAGLPNTRDHIEDWTAGWSTGIDLQALSSKQNVNAKSGGSASRNFKRAHWHPYWFGPRSKERVRELRWMHPLLGTTAPVDAHAAPATLH